MNIETVGHVTVNERLPSQRFHRFVDEKVKDWMREHQLAEHSSENPTEYEVSFFDEDPLGEISCLVIVHAGQALWRSWQAADNPRTALSRSLEHLHLDPSPKEDELHTHMLSSKQNSRSSENEVKH